MEELQASASIYFETQKSDVLKDLPPKIMQDIVCELALTETAVRRI